MGLIQPSNKECSFNKSVKIFLKRIDQQVEYTILYKENGLENGTVQFSKHSN
jgi:hypothetical protein